MNEQVKSPEMLQLKVDEGICTGARLCLLAAENVFEFDDDKMVSRVVVAPVEGTDAVWDAIEGCPTEAISAANAETGEQVFP